jgi:cytochrome bd ubiquinol oxidase subunit II
VSTADAVAAVLWLGATFYAVFGGADFGAGFWALLAGRSSRGDRVREVVGRAIGPVWEANHVWLVFVFVVLWTSFPTVFGAIMSTLFIPLCLAALASSCGDRDSPSSTSPAKLATAACRSASSASPRC